MHSQVSLVLFALLFLVCATALSEDRKEADAAADLAARVNTVLTQYIAVENEFFKWTPRRASPLPDVFERMDFSGYSKTLRSLERDLDRAQAEVGRQRPARAEVREFYSGISDYINQLRASIAALEGISTKLIAVTQDPAKYSSKEYSADMDRYRKLRTDYTTAGTKLNEIFRRVQR
jgi:hypothetical protein